MHATVGVVLVSIFVFGLTWITKAVNSDTYIPELENELATRGHDAARQYGCVACHTLDGTVGIDPSLACMVKRKP